MKNIALENKGSLITIAGTSSCLGYLITHQSSAFDATHGKVDVTLEEAATHNACLDVAMVEGLDKNCAIGQYGTFYFNRTANTVNTWMGTLLSESVSMVGKKVSFTRHGKHFLGLLRSGDEAINFKRIA